MKFLPLGLSKIFKYRAAGAQELKKFEKHRIIIKLVPLKEKRVKPTLKNNTKSKEMFQASIGFIRGEGEISLCSSVIKQKRRLSNKLFEFSTKKEISVNKKEDMNQNVEL